MSGGSGHCITLKVGCEEHEDFVRDRIRLWFGRYFVGISFGKNERRMSELSELQFQQFQDTGGGELSYRLITRRSLSQLSNARVRMVNF